MTDLAVCSLPPYALVPSETGGTISEMAGPPRDPGRPSRALDKLVDEMQIAAVLHDLRAELDGVKDRHESVTRALDGMKKALREQGDSVRAALVPPVPEPWFKRYGIFLTLAFGLAISMATWWIANDRTMVRMEVEHQYERQVDQNRVESVERRMQSVETEQREQVERLNEVTQTQAVRLERIETMLEQLSRRQGLRPPPPVDELEVQP